MTDPQTLYTQANEAAQKGDRAQARDLLYEVILREPDNTKAWLLLSKVEDDPAQVEKCLRKAQAIDTDNLEVSRRLIKLTEEKENWRILASGSGYLWMGLSFTAFMAAVWYYTSGAKFILP